MHLIANKINITNVVNMANKFEAQTPIDKYLDVDSISRKIKSKKNANPNIIFTILIKT